MDPVAPPRNEKEIQSFDDQRPLVNGLVVLIGTISGDTPRGLM